MIDGQPRAIREKRRALQARSSTTRTNITASWKANWACWSARSTTKAKKAAAIPRAASTLIPDEAVEFVKAIRRGFTGRRHRQFSRRLQIQRRAAPGSGTTEGNQKSALDAGPGRLPAGAARRIERAQGSGRSRSTNTAASWAKIPPACPKPTSKSPAASAAPRSISTPTCAWP